MAAWAPQGAAGIACYVAWSRAGLRIYGSLVWEMGDCVPIGLE